MARTLSAALTLAVLPAGALAQQVLLDVPGRSPIAPLGDVDADGRDDLLAATACCPNEVRAFSGQTGAVLFTLPQPAAALAGLEDFDGDGVPDALVGIGMFVRVYSGVTGQVVYQNPDLGGCLASDVEWASSVGDVDGDGRSDFVYAQEFLWDPGDGSTGVILSSTGAHLCAECDEICDFGGPSSAVSGPVAGLGDADGDGVGDFAITRIGDGCSVDQRVEVRSGVGCGTIGLLDLADVGRVDVQALGDLDGDGLGDVLVLGRFGADDRVRAYSGSGFELALLRDFGAVPATGTVAIAAPGDVDCDGSPDVLVLETAGVDRVRLLSGADGSLLQEVVEGPSFDVGGDVDAAGDVDGDGVPDWMVTGAAGGSAVVRVFAGPGPAAAAYCTGKVNTDGCAPSMGYGGTPTLSGPDDFVVRASGALPQKPGLLFWGSTGPAALPFLGGTLCVLPPLVRTPVQTAAGSGLCGGSFAFWFSQGYAASAGLTGGQTLHAQYWMRDPLHPDGTGVGLSDGLAFDLCE